MSDHSERRFMLNVMAAILEGTRVNTPGQGYFVPSVDLAFMLENDVNDKMEEEMVAALKEEQS